MQPRLYAFDELCDQLKIAHYLIDYTLIWSYKCWSVATNDEPFAIFL